MLNVRQIERLKGNGKLQRILDDRGLYIEVTPDGKKRWRFRYRFDGRQKMISLGLWPDVTLKAARKRRDEAREALEAGDDPSAIRKARRIEERGADTFEAVAREWVAKKTRRWSESHHVRVLRCLERDVFPRVGRRPVGKVESPDVLDILQRIETRGALETAHRCHWYLGQVFAYAIATGRAKRNPARDIQGALEPAVGGHFPAIVDPVELGAFLRAVDGYHGNAATRYALQLAPLVFVRPLNLRTMEAGEVDLDTATWTIPGGKMKGGADHVVPLATQAVGILREAIAAARGGRLVFPSLRSTDRPMSDNTLGAALRRMGYAQGDVTIHGFRATARTLLDEVLGFRVDLIEHQLAHVVRDPLGRAYNRTQFLIERRQMMQAWADYLDQLRGDAGASTPPPPPPPKS